MGPRSRDVKQKRPYDSARRREQARQTRERIIDAAERRFLRDGYGPTTIAAIADDAAVSADTVYKSFGGKPGLVRAIRARALEGEGPVPAEQRSDELQARELDGRRIIEAWGALTLEVAPRVAPILLLIRAAAASDPEVAALLEEMDEDRLRRMTDNARRLGRAGHLRAGITVARAADVLWTYSAPELYELLVLRRGWTPARFSGFIVDAMIDALL
jgi:AcrR family transcriptional regulator